MGYTVGGTLGFYDSTVSTAINIAADGCDEINAILKDVSTDSILGNDVTGGAAVSGTDTSSKDTVADGILQGEEVLSKYNVEVGGAGISINSAAGAMVVDDLMQKISTKVQVAAQLLSTANNIAKTATRIMQQG